MNLFKTGDYIIDKFGIVFHLNEEWLKDVANANAENFRHATEDEIELYQLGAEE